MLVDLLLILHAASNTSVYYQLLDHHLRPLPKRRALENCWFRRPISMLDPEQRARTARFRCGSNDQWSERAAFCA
jgi:hypothetical protein